MAGRVSTRFGDGACGKEERSGVAESERSRAHPESLRCVSRESREWWLRVVAGPGGGWMV